MLLLLKIHNKGIRISFPHSTFILLPMVSFMWNLFEILYKDNFDGVQSSVKVHPPLFRNHQGNDVRSEIQRSLNIYAQQEQQTVELKENVFVNGSKENCNIKQKNQHLTRIHSCCSNNVLIESEIVFTVKNEGVLVKVFGA